MGAIPLMIVVTAHFFLPDEKLTWQKFFGFVLGFIGLIILLDPKAITNFSMGGEALIGELAILGGCACYTIHSISAKHLGFELPYQQAAGVIIAGAIMALVFALIVNPTGLQNQPAEALWATVGLGILPTAIATLLMYTAMERSGPSFVATSNYLVPVFALLLGAIVLNETLDIKIILALAFILVGIAVSRYGPRKA